MKIRRRALLQARILGTPHPSPPTPMSSTTTSLSNFSSILDAALESYAKQTGIDLTNHPFADKLQNCRSPDDILQILSERESAFKDYRDKYRNLIDHVRPIVQVVHVFSDVLGEVAGLVSSGIASSTSNRMFTPKRCRYNRQRQYLSELMFSSQYISPFSFSPGPHVIPIYAGCYRRQCKL